MIYNFLGLKLGTFIVQYVAWFWKTKDIFNMQNWMAYFNLYNSAYIFIYSVLKVINIVTYYYYFLCVTDFSFCFLKKAVTFYVFVVCTCITRYMERQEAICCSSFFPSLCDSGNIGHSYWNLVSHLSGLSFFPLF